MKKKKLCFLLGAMVLPCAFLLPSCAMGGNDTETYNLTIAIGSELQALGVEVEAENGSYEEQERIDLSVPYLAGYFFGGWADQNGNPVGGCLNYSTAKQDGKYEYSWNIDKNATVHCEYRKVNFTIEYYSDLTPGQKLTDESYVSSYTVDQGEVELTPCVEQREGYTFKNWAYNGFGKQEFFDKLDKETVSFFNVDSENETVVLFPHYEPNDCSLSIVVKDGSGNLLDDLLSCVEIEATAQSSGFPMDVKSTYKYGEAEISIRVDLAEIDVKGYDFDGIYIDGIEVGDRNVLGYYAVNEDVEIVISVSERE